MLVQTEVVNIFNGVLNQKAKLRKGGMQATYHCPFCVDKNLSTYKLEVAINGPRIGNYHCWRCNTKGRTFGSLLKRLGAPAQYREKLFKLTGDIKISKNYQFKKTYNTPTLPEEFHPLSVSKNTPEFRNAIMYLKRRGLLPEDIIRYNIGYCESGEYESHIIIPSYDANGVLNFFMGRRYYETPGVIPHKKPELPMDIIGFESFINWSQPLNLCEGFFDAIAVRNNAIPLFGKFLCDNLLKKMIINKVRQVNMILDDDAIADSMKNCERILRIGIEVRLVKLDKKDPSILGFRKMHALIKTATPFGFDEMLSFKLK